MSPAEKLDLYVGLCRMVDRVCGNTDDEQRWRDLIRYCEEALKRLPPKD